MIIIIIHNRSRMLNNRSSNRTNPILLLLIRISNKIHSLRLCRQLKSKLFVNHIFRAFHSQTRGDRNNATWHGATSDDRVFEPEKLALFENEPTATPRFDVLALFCEPAGAFGVRPELNAVVVAGGLGGAGDGLPEA